jgi:hypothetical protein
MTAARWVLTVVMEVGAAVLPLVRGARRKPGVFSGLLKCGWCGASYTAYQRQYLIRAAYREKGPTACTNSRTVRRPDVEARAGGPAQPRARPGDAVAAYLRAYHAAWAEEDATGDALSNAASPS